MKRFVLALAASLFACLASGSAFAVNMPVRDAQNVVHTVCSQIKGGIDYPCQLMYGQRADGTYGPILTDSLGNTLSGAFKLQGADTLSAGASSTRKLLPTGPTVLYTNSGTVDLYFALGGSTVTATTSSAKLGIGRSIALSSDGVTYVAAITSTGTASLDMISGAGNPSISGGGGSGGGGGGAVTIIDGGDVTKGAKADTAWDLSSGNPTQIAIDKAIALKVEATRALLAAPLTITGIGEVQASPTANTLLDRVKTLHTDITALQALIGEVQASPTTNTLLDRLKTLQGYLDTVESLIGTTNSSLTTIAGYVDQLEGYVDGIEALIAATNTKLDTVNANLTATQGVIGAATAPAKMSLSGCVYLTSALTLTNGQSAACRLDSHGSVVMTCANADGTFCGDTSAVNITQVAGATIAQGHGVAATAIRVELPTDGTGLVTADITKVGGTAITAGLGNVSSGSPRVTTAFPGAVFYNINMSTATTTEIIPLSGSTVTYVLLSKVAVGGTTTVTLKYGTGTNCGTGTTSLEGPYNLTDQNGWVEGNGLTPILTVPAGKALCVTSSAAVQVSGKFGAVQF